MSDCIFCKIIKNELPANILFEDENCLAFHDIHPQAPIHFLVIPKNHLANLVECDEVLLGQLLSVSKELAIKLGMTKDGFRTVINCGRFGGQTVHHLHVHVMGGRRFTWPPG